MTQRRNGRSLEMAEICNVFFAGVSTEALEDCRMRKTWIVCYDVRCPKRWRLIYKLMRGYGDHVQLSVFRCVLSPREAAELRLRIEDVANKQEDHILLIDLGPAEGRGDRVTISIGKPLPEAEAVVKVL